MALSNWELSWARSQKHFEFLSLNGVGYDLQWAVKRSLAVRDGFVFWLPTSSPNHPTRYFRGFELQWR
jgi:hypothetical protein